MIGFYLWHALFGLSNNASLNVRSHQNSYNVHVMQNVKGASQYFTILIRNFICSRFTDRKRSFCNLNNVYPLGIKKFTGSPHQLFAESGAREFQ